MPAHREQLVLPGAGRHRGQHAPGRHRRDLIHHHDGIHFRRQLFDVRHDLVFDRARDERGRRRIRAQNLLARDVEPARAQFAVCVGRAHRVRHDVVCIHVADRELVPHNPRVHVVAYVPDHIGRRAERRHIAGGIARRAGIVPFFAHFIHGDRSFQAHARHGTIHVLVEINVPHHHDPRLLEPVHQLRVIHTVSTPQCYPAVTVSCAATKTPNYSTTRSQTQKQGFSGPRRPPSPLADQVKPVHEDRVHLAGIVDRRHPEVHPR